MNNQRRRKKRHTHGTKTVDVSRGKNGYGFTISGQQPCILSCIVGGSPADRAGLKTGDFLLAVNNLNVSKASHDDVVRLVGSSSNTLTLTIAENLNNDSDSSDEDFQARPKNKYPNRVRLRQQQQHQQHAKNGDRDGFGRERTENIRGGRQAGSIQQGKKQAGSRSRALSPVVERYGRDGRDGSRGPRAEGPTSGPSRPFQPHQQHVGSAGSGSRGVENMDPLSVAVYPRRQKHLSAGAHPSSSSSSSSAVAAPQGTKHTIITREMRMRSHSHPETHQHAPPPAFHSRPTVPAVPAPSAPAAVKEESSLGSASESLPPNFRIIVGYVGSVEMPRDAHLPYARTQSIRGAMRRLRVDHRVHTLVLMDIYVGGIRMTNTLGSIVALYAAERIAFSGTAPDDRRFFAVVTMHKDDADRAGRGGGGGLADEDDEEEEELSVAGSSCHVFMVDPEMAVHSTHAPKAKSFGIQCTVDPTTQMCAEFPQFAATVVKHISKLYRKRNTSTAGDAPAHEAQNGHLAGGPPVHLHGVRHSESSNSDSGLGFGREEVPATNEHVYVVEMADASRSSALNASSSQDSSLNWTAERSAFHPATDVSMYNRSTAGESDLSGLMPPPLPPAASTSGFRYVESCTSDPSMSSHVNTSVSSNEVSFQAYHPAPHGPHLHGPLPQQGTPNDSAFDRLNLRVMPDPRGVLPARSGSGSNIVVSSQDILDKQSSADNLRRSMHRYMQTQTQQRFLEQSGSDADSMRSNESNNSGGGGAGGVVGGGGQRAKVTRSQGVSTAEVIDAHNKLSPRVFPAQPGPPPTFPASSTTPQASAFLVPAVPVVSKPPVPDRRPILPPHSQARTPVRERPLPERPKSTPPFRGNAPTPPPDTDDDYDSDPGSVMAGGVGEDGERWDGAIAGPDDDDDDDDNGAAPSQRQKTPAGKVTKGKRRFSEGFFLKKSRDKENLENSRLAKGGSFKQIKLKRRPTLSTSHESLVVSDAGEFPQKKLNGAPSATSLHHTSTKRDVGENGVGGLGGGRTGGGPGQHGQRSARWAIGFDRLLEDSCGLSTFTEFLKGEFSSENINFWVKCEQFKAITDDELRKVEAARLWNLHLGTNSADPVNIDAATLAGVEKGLEEAPPTLFNGAQSHIFQLMKQDSYPRFLKSDLYKQCVVAEMEGRPLPFSGGLEDDDRPRDEKKHGLSKSKSSISMDKRISSLFTFSWNSKSKSEKRLKPADPDLKGWTTKNADGTVRVGVGSLDLVDLNVMSKEIKAPPPREEDTKTEGGNNNNKEVRLCRVILPDGSTTVLQARPGLEVRATLDGLCRRRTLSLAALEVYLQGSEKPLDLTRDAASLASREIRVESRVLFQVDLGTPSRRTLVVRARPTQTLRQTLRPIFNKHSSKADNLVAHLYGTDKSVDLDAPVLEVEGKHILVQTEEDFAGGLLEENHGPLPCPRFSWSVGDFRQFKLVRKEWPGFGSHRSKPPLPPRSKSTVSLDSGGGGGDDHGQLLQDIVDGKVDVAHLFDENGIFDPDKKDTKNRSDEGRPSGIFGLIRGNSFGEKDAAKQKAKAAVLSQQQAQNKAPPDGGMNGTDRPKPRARGPVKDREAETLFKQLDKLSGRLDDQRGLSKEMLEMPDFLKIDRSDGGDQDGRRSSFRSRERRNSDSSLLEGETSRRLSQTHPPSEEAIGSPASGKIPYMDQSFSQDGVIPTNAEAERLFGNERRGSEIGTNSPADLDRMWTMPGERRTARQVSREEAAPRLSVRAASSGVAVRPRALPRSRTPDPKRALLPVGEPKSPRVRSRKYAVADEGDLSDMRPLPTDSNRMPPPSHDVVPREAEADLQSGNRSIPARPRKPAPLPPPRKTLTTPKKFFPPPPPVTPRHSHQNSTSSELSHHSDATTTSSSSAAMAPTPVSRNRGTSPSTTPSPTTHDLVLGGESSGAESSSSSERKTRPLPPPRPSKRGPHCSGSSSSADEATRQAKKTLHFDGKPAERQKDSTDMQVSYV